MGINALSDSFNTVEVPELCILFQRLSRRIGQYTRSFALQWRLLDPTNLGQGLWGRFETLGLVKVDIAAQSQRRRYPSLWQPLLWPKSAVTS